MSKKKRVVWVVMHYEIMGCADDSWLDALQFHVSSSLAKAETYMRALHTEPCSWWQVHPHIVDTGDFIEGEEVHYFSHRGKPLKEAPHEKAWAAFQKLAARYPERYPTSAKSR